MSQKQPQRPLQQEEQPPQQQQDQPLKYGDVFPSVAGSDLATKPIAPRDAAAMQAAETQFFGHTVRGGGAALMESAANKNKQAGLVGHDEATLLAANQGVTVTDHVEGETRVITEMVGGQPIGQYVAPPAQTSTPEKPDDVFTIGEALEATALTAGDKPVDQKDAAAIQAAEIRATGTGVITPGGVAAVAQSAATYNERTPEEQNKATLSDVLGNATARLPADRAVTRADAEGITLAEVRNDPKMMRHPGGVASSMVAAAKYNEGDR